MAEIKMTDGTTARALMKDLVERRVRTLAEMSNGFMTIPAGTICAVTTTHQGLLSLKSEPCPHCGVRIHISRVSRFAVEFFPTEKG